MFDGGFSWLSDTNFKILYSVHMLHIIVVFHCTNLACYGRVTATDKAARTTPTITNCFLHFVMHLPLMN